MASRGAEWERGMERAVEKARESVGEGERERKRKRDGEYMCTIQYMALPRPCGRRRRARRMKEEDRD